MRHFVKDGASWRPVNQIVAVLLCHTLIVMLKEFPCGLLHVLTRPVDDIAQMPLNALFASGIFEFDYCHGTVSVAAFSISVRL